MKQTGLRRPFALLGFSALGTLMLAAALGSGARRLTVPVLIAAVILLTACAVLGGIYLSEKKKFGGERLKGALKVLLPVAAAAVTVWACLFIYSSAYDREVGEVLSLDGVTAQIRGTVMDAPEEKYGKVYYKIKADTVTVNGEDSGLSPFTARISAVLPFECETGDGVECKVRFMSFSESRLLFNTRNSRLAEGCAIGGYVIDLDAVKTYKNIGFFPTRASSYVRRRLGEVFERRLTRDDAALIRAVLSGERYRISDEEYSLFRYIGGSHLLVVSGLHMAVIAAFMTELFRKIFRRRVVGDLLTAAGILFYLFIIGFHASAVRSGIMYIIYLVADCIGETADSLNSLGAAVFVICMFNPFSGGDVGLALSVFATLGIILWADGLTELFTRPFHEKDLPVLWYCAGALAVGCAAAAATLPIQTLVFGGASLLAPVTSVALVLPFTALLYLAVISAVISFVPFISPAAEPLLLLTGLLARAIRWSARVLNRVPDMFFGVASDERLLVLCLALFLAGLAALFVRYREFSLPVFALSAAILAAGVIGPANIDGAISIAVPADSSCVAVIKGSSAVVLSLGGYMTNIPGDFLRENGITRIEALFMPVLDNESRRAASGLLREFKTERVILPEGAYAGSELSFVSKDTVREYAADGESFRVLGGVNITSEWGMSRLFVDINDVTSVIETVNNYSDGRGRDVCSMLFTTERKSKIISPFTVLQNSDIIDGEAGPEGWGRYALAEGDGLFADVLPNGRVRFRGDTRCLSWTKPN